MPAKKKKINSEILFEQDTILISLKERYFRLYAREMLTNTKDLTKLLDELEVTINNRKEELTNGN